MGKTYRRRPGDDEFNFQRRKKFENRRKRRLDNYNKKISITPVMEEQKKKEYNSA